MRFKSRHISRICATGVVIILAGCTIVQAALADEDVSRNILRLRREQKTTPTPSVEKTDAVQKQTEKEGLQKPPQYNGVKAASPARPAVEGEGKYKLQPKSITRRDSMLFAASQYLNRLPKRPSQLRGLPKDLSGEASYFTARFGGRDIPAIIDSTKSFRDYIIWSSTRQRYVLYLDTDGDNDLSDEKGLLGRQMQASRFSGAAGYKFGPILIEFAGSESRLKTEVYADTYSGRQLNFYTPTYLAGTIRLNKATYDVAVIDGSFDGRYDKTLSIPIENVRRPECDFFAIDLNSDHIFDGFSNYRLSDISPLSRMIKIKDVYYSIDVADDGGFLELKKITPQFGTLDLGGADVNTLLLSDAAHQYLAGDRRQWQLPVGKYTARLLELSRTDSTAGRWAIIGYRETGKLTNFEIHPGETLPIKIGPPLLVKTTAEQQGNNIMIGVDLEGQAGEIYGAQITRNSRPLPPPRFRLVDESGKVLASGEFKYG